MRARSACLVVLLASLVLGCKSQGIDDAAIRAAADSAARDAWSAVAVNAGHLHSAIYDSLHGYYRSAAELESLRSSTEDTLRQLASEMLDGTSMLSDESRARMEKEFEGRRDALALIDRSADSVRTACGGYLERLLRSGTKSIETTAQGTLRTAVLATERFIPRWRSAYDSLEHDATGIVLAMLAVFDSAEGNVMIDSTEGYVYRFRDLTLTSRFNALRDSLQKIGNLESERRGNEPDRK